MTGNHNHDDDATSSKRFKACDNSGAAPWLDLNNDALFLVMMQLAVVDFVAFGGVCKSWRSLALSNWPKFMASKPPMSLCISTDASIDKICYLEDFERRKFKTLLPRSGGRDCVGLSCGYLVLFGRKTKDFWLVNPITRHEFHFPAFPGTTSAHAHVCRAIIFFSKLIKEWVFVVTNRRDDKIWFSTAGKGAWNHVSTKSRIIDLHAFKGKIYAIDIGIDRGRGKTDWRVCEMRLNPEPNLTLLEINDIPVKNLYNTVFVSSYENLYVMDYRLTDSFHELDFGEMKWVSPKEKTIEEYAYFGNIKMYTVVIIPELSAGTRSQYKRYDYFHDTTKESLKGRFFCTSMWYFPHDCLNLNLIDKE